MMSDVIEVMARVLDDGDYPMSMYRRDVIDMLEAAEKAGWRLVPHKKNCRCDECHLDRLQDRVATLEAERRELVLTLKIIRDWPFHSPIRDHVPELAREALTKIDAQ